MVVHSLCTGNDIFKIFLGLIILFAVKKRRYGLASL